MVFINSQNVRGKNIKRNKTCNLAVYYFSLLCPSHYKSVYMLRWHDACVQAFVKYVVCKFDTFSQVTWNVVAQYDRFWHPVTCILSQMHDFGLASSNFDCPLALIKHWQGVACEDSVLFIPIFSPGPKKCVMDINVVFSLPASAFLVTLLHFVPHSMPMVRVLLCLRWSELANAKRLDSSIPLSEFSE